MFDKTLAVDPKGVFLCMKHETAHMLKSGGGAIVNNASIAGMNRGAGNQRLYRRQAWGHWIERAMQSAVSLDCCRDQIFHIGLVSDIALHKDGFTPVALDRFDCFHSSRINIADHNLRAALRKKLRSGATNASTPARDKRDLP